MAPRSFVKITKGGFRKGVPRIIVGVLNHSGAVDGSITPMHRRYTMHWN